MTLVIKSAPLNATGFVEKIHVSSFLLYKYTFLFIFRLKYVSQIGIDNHNFKVLQNVYVVTFMHLFVEQCI